MPPVASTSCVVVRVSAGLDNHALGARAISLGRGDETCCDTLCRQRGVAVSLGKSCFEVPHVRPLCRRLPMRCVRESEAILPRRPKKGAGAKLSLPETRTGQNQAASRTYRWYSPLTSGSSITPPSSVVPPENPDPSKIVAVCAEASQAPRFLLSAVAATISVLACFSRRLPENHFGLNAPGQPMASRRTAAGYSFPGRLRRRPQKRLLTAVPRTQSAFEAERSAAERWSSG